MDTAELKLEIIRQVDSLDKESLQQLLGVIINMVHNKQNTDDWLALSEEEQAGLLQSIESLDKDLGISHQKVMDKVRKKYND